MNIAEAKRIFEDYEKRLKEIDKEYKVLHDQKREHWKTQAKILEVTVQKNPNLLNLNWRAETRCEGVEGYTSFKYSYGDEFGSLEIIRLVRCFGKDGSFEIGLEEGVEFFGNERDEELWLTFDTPERAAKFFKANGLTADLFNIKKSLDEHLAIIDKYRRLINAMGSES